jgi:hypothetical protein
MWCLEEIIRRNQEAYDKWKKTQPKTDQKQEIKIPERVKVPA